MPRYKRALSETGCYHIMIRGNNKINIFGKEEDKKKMINILKQIKTKEEFQLYGYCIMDNHTHFVIQDTNNNIASIMKSINVSYAYYYNKKYNKIGHVFQDRYKSEAIKDDKYLLSAIRYIHNNPIKAGKVDKLGSYQYSSYQEYTNKENVIEKDIINYILGMFSNSINSFIEFNKKDDNLIVFGGVKEKKKQEFEKGYRILEEYCDSNGINNRKQLKGNEKIVEKLLEETTLSYRNVAEILEISRATVYEIGKRVRNKD